MSHRSLIALLILSCLGVGLTGCGPSKAEMMLKAARRTRPKDENETENKPRPTKKAAKPTKVASAPPAPSGRAAKKATKSETDQAKPKADPGKETLTVDELKKKSKLSGDARRAWSANNLVAVHAAIEKYYDDKGYYFGRIQKNKNGLECLSWRVALLPYLGYHDLYKRFDLNKPWYMEPNKSLLKYIPKEYVSPERFDTMTNIQLPCSKHLMWHTKKVFKKDAVEDGFDNTIMLLEVNDDEAVEWTAPLDWEPGKIHLLSETMHKLREDGTFAIWASGWPVLLSKKCTDDQLKYAFTSASGDIPVQAQIHQPLTTGPVSRGSVAGKKKPAAAVASKPKSAAPPPKPKVQIKRDPLPAELDIANAMKRLRTVFEEEMAAAKDTPKQRSLAKKFLNVAKTLKAKPDEAYALLVAAERLATTATDAKTLIEAIDARVGQFEVDAFQENLASLSTFADQRLNPRLIEGGDEFVKRAIYVIYAATQEDEFLRANKLARAAGRLTRSGSSPGEIRVPKLLSKLQGHLGAAQAAYDDAKEYLAILRIDPQDDEAASRFGQFLCFNKGDWKTGLPLLGRTSNDDLAAVIRMEIEGVKTDDEVVALADGWWELAQRTSGVYRQAAINRATLYYERAFKEMPHGLERMHVKNQLSSVKETDPSSPLALIEELAKIYKLNLEQNLASLATSKFEQP